MNRLAVVLAADSASTVTYWTDRGKEERYFKGANKIFQLSNYHPVGLMIFDAADVLRVPWEVVVKEFRGALQTKSFNTLEEYATEFFSFLDESARLFPASVQKEVFLEAARSAATGLLFNTDKADLSEDARRQAIDAAVSARRAALEAMPVIPGIAPHAPAEAVVAWHAELVGMLESWRAPLGVMYPSSVDDLAEVGIVEIFKNPKSFLATTGLVFAGFGDHDIFPAMISYRSYGMIGGQHVAQEETRISIDHQSPAWLSAFAQTSMSDTFSLGLSEDVYASVMQALAENLPRFVDDVCAQSGVDRGKIVNLPQLLATATEGISTAILQKAREQHAYPLRRVLGSLPVDEMASLAETLISLQSLKEKVTKPSETVGGPIDVAVITKSEGLEWIKRKHFFDPALNSRYMQRQAAVYR
jgi:hypothetical protein